MCSQALIELFEIFIEVAVGIYFCRLQRNEVTATIYKMSMTIPSLRALAWQSIWLRDKRIKYLDSSASLAMTNHNPRVFENKLLILVVFC